MVIKMLTTLKRRRDGQRENFHKETENIRLWNRNPRAEEYKK